MEDRPKYGKMAGMRMRMGMRKRMRIRKNSSTLTPFNQKYDYGLRANFLSLRNKMKRHKTTKTSRKDWSDSRRSCDYVKAK